MNPVILHIEDDENDRLFLRRAFFKAQMPAELQNARDGETAICYLSGKNEYQDRTRFPFPSLVLLDLKLPLKNGFEVLQWVRLQPAFGWLPVVVFSSSENESDIQQAYKLGANSYLVKPVSFEELVTAAREIYNYWFVLNKMAPR